MAAPRQKPVKALVMLRYLIEFLALMLVNIVLFILPWFLTWRLGRGIGWLIYRLFNKRRSTAEHNVRRAFPEASVAETEQIMRGCYLHWGEGFISTLKLWMLSQQKARSLVTAPGLLEYVKSAQAAGTPVLYFTGHFGSWEMAGRFVSSIGPGAASIYRIQKNPLVNGFLTWIRQYHHLTLINSWAGMPAFELGLKKYLGLAVVGDQYKGKHGVTVNFFGIPSRTPRGAAILTYRAKPKLVFLVCTQHRGKYQIAIEEIPYTLPTELNDDWVHEIIQLLTGKLEQYVRKYPEQYFWFHRRWRDLDRQEAREDV